MVAGGGALQDMGFPLGGLPPSNEMDLQYQHKQCMHSEVNQPLMRFHWFPSSGDEMALSSKPASKSWQPDEYTSHDQRPEKRHCRKLINVARKTGVKRPITSWDDRIVEPSEKTVPHPENQPCLMPLAMKQWPVPCKFDLRTCAHLNDWTKEQMNLANKPEDSRGVNAGLMLACNKWIVTQCKRKKKLEEGNCQLGLHDAKSCLTRCNPLQQLRDQLWHTRAPFHHLLNTLRHHNKLLWTAINWSNCSSLSEEMF